MLDLLLIFSHVYLTITRSNIQLDIIFLAKLSSLKNTYLALLKCKFSYLETNNPIFFMLDLLLYIIFFNMLIFLLYVSVVYM
jgi:hypothetical protein